MPILCGFPGFSGNLAGVKFHKKVGSFGVKMSRLFLLGFVDDFAALIYPCSCIVSTALYQSGIDMSWEQLESFEGEDLVMIYVTGDCHGDFQRFTKRHRAAFRFTEEDYIIICGDFGLLWAKNKELNYNLSWLSALPFTILWVQGNHENYDMIAEYPIEQWNGGSVRHIVREKIILLERGQVFQIDGKSFFAFGGASSHDIQGGILDRDSPSYDSDRRRAIRQGLPYRVKHSSWWEWELPDEQEMQEKLSRYFGSAGYGNIVYERDVLTGYFDELEAKMKFRHWFCGHYHVNLELDEKHTVLYGDIVPLTGVQ